ncbi:hypothetical protein HYH03_018040 [Edaphochlamys debaryana]|uniref:Uncharacterized protein n=1 Tax=Edaphochlamys debaryana TaxID=47281 RepID=A0A836BNP6_9CHLO|nr:hypothetical protein HYH03_018040 [Edaphochlamys debaryana]|eukprot:KAG2483057.1 hypothetical protein HYH03_018040 [Edaphochlamys debaryana]
MHLEEFEGPEPPEARAGVFIARAFRSGRTDNDVKNVFHGTLRGRSAAATSSSHSLFRAYVLAVGPNCADDGVRRNAYEAARQAALEAGAPVGPAELPRRRGAASPGASPAAGCRRGPLHTVRAGGGVSIGAAAAAAAGASAPRHPARGGKLSARDAGAEVACPAQSWPGAAEDSDGHVRPSPPGAGSTRREATRVSTLHGPGPVGVRLSSPSETSGTFSQTQHIPHMPSAASSSQLSAALDWMQPGPPPAPVGLSPGWQWEAAGPCGDGSSHAAVEGCTARDVLSELKLLASAESTGSPAPTAAAPEAEWAAGWGGVEGYGSHSHHTPVPHIAGPCGVGSAAAGVACADSDWDALQTWPEFDHEATPVTPAGPLSASGAWPRSVAGALPTATSSISGGGLTTRVYPLPLMPQSAAALLPPRLASAPAAAWGVAAAAPPATDPRAQGLWQQEQRARASDVASPYPSPVIRRQEAYAAAAPALPWAQGPLRAPAGPWGPPYGADGWPQPSACSLPGVGSAPGPTKPRNPPVGAPWPFQPPWAHAAPAPVPPGAAAPQAAQGPYTDPLGAGSDLGVPWDVTDDLDSVMLDAWLAMRSD